MSATYNPDAIHIHVTLEQLKQLAQDLKTLADRHTDKPESFENRVLNEAYIIISDEVDKEERKQAAFRRQLGLPENLHDICEDVRTTLGSPEQGSSDDSNLYTKCGYCGSDKRVGTQCPNCQDGTDFGE